MWSNIFALSGLVLALVGSLYLTVRMFARIRSLQDITGVQISDQITHPDHVSRHRYNNSDGNHQLCFDEVFALGAQSIPGKIVGIRQGYLFQDRLR